MVASEVAPWAKTGGLADVTGALPRALEELGHAVTVIMPRYRGIRTGTAPLLRSIVRVGSASHDVDFHLLDESGRRRIVAIDIPALYDRDGLYGAAGRDFADNAERFCVLAAAALDFIERDPKAQPVDVVHAHDWQAGLVPALLRLNPERFPRARAAGLVLTIHNLAYQGLFDRDVIPTLGLPWSLYTPATAEFWGQFSYLKAGITFSDVLTTVSPTYARETLTPEFGSGMEGVLKAREDHYVGILNGIDTSLWNPATDPHLPARYTPDDMSGKVVCKRALLGRMGLSFGDDALKRPLVGMVSRLVEQKGLDLIEGASKELVEMDAVWAFVGTGERRFEEFLRKLAARYPTRVAAFIGFDEPLAHLVEAGADLFLMPSLFEPCGLNQMYSLRYGTVPVVRAVGGLDDTVQPYTARARRANGFKFKGATAGALVRTLRQALRLYHSGTDWRRLMLNGMAADHSWKTSAREYLKVYRRSRQAGAARATPVDQHGKD